MGVIVTRATTRPAGWPAASRAPRSGRRARARPGPAAPQSRSCGGPSRLTVTSCAVRWDTVGRGDGHLGTELDLFHQGDFAVRLGREGHGQARMECRRSPHGPF